MTTKLVMSKAYDCMIEWVRFIEKMFSKLGSAATFISLRRQCISPVSYSMLIGDNKRLLFLSKDTLHLHIFTFLVQTVFLHY